MSVSASRVFAALLAALWLLSFPVAAGAGEIRVANAALTIGEDGYLLDALFDVDIGPRLEETVSHGVPLYFILEFQLTRPRWYWADEHIASRVLHYRLWYHALTRQYRLSIGALHQNFVTLADALRVMARVRNWPVADKAALRPGEIYQAEVRLKLDYSQLPKPFQVSAIGSKDWNVNAEIHRWSFVSVAGEAK